MTKSALRHTATRTYSYSTLILQRLSNGLTLGNITYYSRTTARHQVLTECDQCDVLLGDVPQGEDNLLDVAVKRGKVVIWAWQSDLMPAPAYEYTTPDKVNHAMPNVRIISSPTLVPGLSPVPSP